MLVYNVMTRTPAANIVYK